MCFVKSSESAKKVRVLKHGGYTFLAQFGPLFTEDEKSCSSSLRKGRIKNVDDNDIIVLEANVIMDNISAALQTAEGVVVEAVNDCSKLLGKWYHTVHSGHSNCSNTLQYT